MKISRENYYILLELQLDPPENDKNRIERAIEEKQDQWSEICRNAPPSRARKAEAYLEMLPDIRRVMSDAGTRQKEAEQAVIKEKEKYEKIDEAIELVSLDGSITEEAVSELSRMLEVDEAVIRERIKVPIVQKKVVEKLEPSLYRQITDNLEIIEKKSLYDFLGVQANTGLDALRASTEKIAADLKTNSIKDTKYTAKQALVGHCFDLFKTEEKRRKYDASLAYQSLDELNKYINITGINGIISIEAFDFLMEKAVAMGIKFEEAEEHIIAYCEEKKWRVHISEEKQRKWSEIYRNAPPSRALKAQAFLDMLPDIKRVMSDADERREEAKKAKETFEKEKYKELDEAIALFSEKGVIFEEQLYGLYKRFPFAEEDVRKRIKVPIVITKVVEKLGPWLYTQITNDLKTIGKKSLYEFLGCDDTSDVKTLLLITKQKVNEIRRNSNRTAILDASLELTGHCSSVFKSEEMKKKYDASLANQKLEELNKAIFTTGSVSGIVESEDFETLIKKAVDIVGVTRVEAEEHILKYCLEKKWRVRTGNRPPKENMKRCAHCRVMNDSDSKKCFKCGLPLEVNCPKCKEINRSGAKSCRKCGYLFENTQETSSPPVKDAKVFKAKSRERIMLEPSTKVYGIDLGTTYSSIAYVDEYGKPIIIPNDENERITPSVVFFDDGDVIVGNEAKSNSELYRKQVVSFVKRAMGDPNFLFEYNGKTYKPEEISGLILRRLVNDAKQHTGEEITDVVITCPAYFGINEREATRVAGVIQGLNVRQILNEPTAAAITYGMTENAEKKIVMVYDLGGGTFDITMIDITPESIEVICTGGDHNLGGKDWDDAVIQYLASQFQQETGLDDDILEDADTSQSLRLAAEKAKKTLSVRDKTRIPITYKTKKSGLELTKQKFEEITKNLLDRTISLTREMLDEAKKKGYETFDEILLVGGSTRMPQVVERLKKEFSLEPKLCDPDEAVVKGAALYGWKLSIKDEAFIKRIAAEKGKSVKEVKEAPREEISEDTEEKVGQAAADDTGLTRETAEHSKKTIKNVCSKSFGVFQDVWGSVLNLIIKNTTVPVEITERFRTREANQDIMEFRLMESEVSERIISPQYAIELGKTSLSLPPGLPANTPIDLTFKLNEEGRLDITALELTDNRVVHITLETNSILQVEGLEEIKQAEIIPVQKETNVYKAGLSQNSQASSPPLGTKADANSVFISYSHKDKKYLDRLMVHLRPLEKDGIIDLWVDTKLKSGDKWKIEIETALKRARAAILIVSADFLASGFIRDNELPPLLEKAEHEGTRIIPVIVTACRFERDKKLSMFQATNDPSKPINKLSAAEREIIYDRIANEIETFMD
jgi:molecular chaperone DnaK (HSP70)